MMYRFMPPPKCQGKIGRLQAPFYHFGETSIHSKVERINTYSTGLVADKVRKKNKEQPVDHVVLSAFCFFRLYIFKRNFTERLGRFYRLGFRRLLQLS